MRHYGFVILFLGLITLGAFGGGVALWQRASENEQVTQQTLRRIHASKDTAAQITTQITRVRQNHELVDAFVSAWEDDVNMASSESFQRDMTNLLVRSNQAHFLSPGPTKPQWIEGYDFAGHKLPGLEIVWSVRGQYYRLMNWLNDVEQAYPLMRFERLEMEPYEEGSSDETISMTVNLFYPDFRGTLSEDSDSLVDPEDITSYLSLLPSMKHGVPYKATHRRPFIFSRSPNASLLGQSRRADEGIAFNTQVREAFRTLNINGLVPSRGDKPGLVSIDSRIFEIGDSLPLPESLGVEEARLIQVRPDELMIMIPNPAGDQVYITVPLTIFPRI